MGPSNSRPWFHDSKQTMTRYNNPQTQQITFFPHNYIQANRKQSNMAKLVHEIDPNPDTVLILKKSCKIFAAWPASVPVQASPELIESPAGEVLPASSPSYEQIGGRGSNAKQKRLAMMKRASFQGNPVVTTTAEPRVVPNFVQKSAHVHMDMVGSGTAGTDHTKESAAPTPADLAKASASTGDEEEVHYHVSSRHLILGSKIFRTMMTEEKWQQGFREEDGLFHSQTEGWDADALLILMNILHAKNNQVPLSLSLEMVAKIAVLVDYYECDMAVQLFASMWIQPLTTNPGVPYFYCRNLMLWMCIARVFERADIFESTTLIALEESKDSIETLELPIWPSIVGKLICKDVVHLFTVLTVIRRH
jgi:hypothetical protein